MGYFSSPSRELISGGSYQGPHIRGAHIRGVILGSSYQGAHIRGLISAWIDFKVMTTLVEMYVLYYANYSMTTPITCEAIRLIM